MAEAKQRETWSHTSTVLAMLANVNRPRKCKTFRPSDFNPCEQLSNGAGEPLKGEVRMLKDVFVKPQKGKP